MKRGQPYIGAFLLKDENADSDIITDLEAVHRTGVFAQITSVFPANSSSSAKDEERDESLTVVLYPHRRIRINEMLPIRTEVDSSAPVTSTKDADAVEPDQEDNQSLGTSATRAREWLDIPNSISTDSTA